MLEFEIQRFAEESPEGGDAGQTEFTPEQFAELKKSYDKLQSQFTKVTQENSDLKKSADRVKEWIEFDNFVNQYPDEVRQSFATNVEQFFNAVQSGNVTQKSITNIDKAIKTAEAAGDTKTADKLTDARDEAVAELMLDKELASLAKQAKSDGIEYDEDDFKEYLSKYLEEEGYEDEFDTKEIKKAYKLYKADKKEKEFEKARKDGLPNVGSGGTGLSVNRDKPKNAPRSVKQAGQFVKEWLGG